MNMMINAQYVSDGNIWEEEREEQDLTLTTGQTPVLLKHGKQQQWSRHSLQICVKAEHFDKWKMVWNRWQMLTPVIRRTSNQLVQMDRNHHDSATDGHDLIQTINICPLRSQATTPTALPTVSRSTFFPHEFVWSCPKANESLEEGAKDTKGPIIAWQPHHNHNRPPIPTVNLHALWMSWWYVPPMHAMSQWSNLVTHQEFRNWAQSSSALASSLSSWSSCVKRWSCWDDYCEEGLLVAVSSLPGRASPHNLPSQASITAPGTATVHIAEHISARCTQLFFMHNAYCIAHHCMHFALCCSELYWSRHPSLHTAMSYAMLCTHSVVVYGQV